MKIHSSWRKLLAAGKKPRRVQSRHFDTLVTKINARENTTSFTLLKLAVPVVILAAVVGGSWYANQRANGYVTRSFQAPGFSYSLKLNKNATEANVSGSKVLQGKDPESGQTLYVYVGKTADTGMDCAADASTQVISTEVIDGQQHNVCVNKLLHLYAMSFAHHGSWYFITVFTKAKGGDLNENTVRTIMRSVRVNDQPTVKA